MAIPENFNSLELTTPLPSNFSKWFRIWEMVDGKWLATIPSKYTPLNTIAIGEDINYNIDVQPTTNIRTAPGLLLGLAADLQNMATDLAKDQGINLSRSAMPNTSPRFGYQIGLFKHQAYFKLRSFAASYNGILGIETSDFTSISSIEYATNSRFKKLYLSHGKILNIRKEFDNIFYVTLCDFETNPDINFKPSGTLSVWAIVDENNEFVRSVEYLKQYKKFTFDLNKSQITDNGELVFDKTTFPDIDKISTGDFFTIDKPWILEDYSLLFEYGLNNNSGFYETNEQKYTTGSKLMGIWHQRPKELIYADGSKETVLLWTLYTSGFDYDSKEVKNAEELKKQFSLPITPEEEKSTGECSEIGGTLLHGMGIMEASIVHFNKIPSSVRIVVFSPDTNLQNFYPPSLIGEFINVDGYYFEIVDHPRPETIEININSLNGPVNFLWMWMVTDVTWAQFWLVKLPRKTVVINVLQQKDWFVNELYYAYPYTEGLWQSDVKSVKVNDYKDKTTEENSQGSKKTTQTITRINPNGKETVESKSILIASPQILKQNTKTTAVSSKTTNISLSAKDVTSTFLGVEEKSKTSCNYLTQRFYKPYKSFGFVNSNFLTMGFYKKYKNWYFFNPGNKKTYKILDASFDNSKTTNITDPVVDINLTIEGDVSSEVTVGLPFVYIFLGEPHNTYSGNHGEMSLSLNLAKSLDTSQWAAYMYGNYYSGTYILPEKASKFYMNSFAYGDNIMLNGGDIPDVLIATPTVNPFLSGVTQKIGNATREYLFFFAPQTQWLVYRSGSCEWRFEPQIKLVITIEPTILNMSFTADKNKLKQSDEIITQITYNVNEENSAYWFVAPSNKTPTTSIYESYYVSESSHANTDLTRQYGLEALPSKGIYFPFEFYSSKKVISPGVNENNVTISTYFPGSLLDSGECLEKIYGVGNSTKNTLTSVINGNTFSRGNLSLEKKSISYVNQNKILQNINYLWAYSTGDSDLYLFYNYNPPDFKIPEFGAKDLNPSRPSVFVLRSDNSGNDFYSPSVKDKTAGSCALMLMYDFDLRGAVINKQETNCFLFGFAYERGDVTGDKDKNENQTQDYQQNLFLAMYCFNLYDIFNKDDTYGLSNEDGKITWLARFPKLKAKSGVNKKDEYGTNKNLYGYMLEEVKLEENPMTDYDEDNDVSNESAQYLISILNQSNAQFNPEQISVSIDASDTITLFLYVSDLIYKDKKDVENKISGIVSLTSINSGVTWVVTVDKNNVPIIYNDHALQANPYQLGQLLFLIDGKSNQLVVKFLYSGITKVVSEGVLQQKIYAIMKETGDIYVYYYRSNGNVSASVSNDGGVTWNFLNNW